MKFVVLLIKTNIVADDLFIVEYSRFRIGNVNSLIIIISPVSEGSGDVMVLRRSRPSPAARNGVNAITQKPRDGLFSNLVYTLVVKVSWPD